MARDVPIARLPLERYYEVLDAAEVDEALRIAGELRERFAGRVLWSLNSTAAGGGVAELLRSLLAYARGAGVDARWLVIDGSAPFFRVTKRLHHALHGSAGDGTPLDEAARRVYEATLATNAAQLAALVRPEDVVLAHDPQTAGLVPALGRAGARVIWRCHIGHEEPGEEVDRGWAFLRPYLEEAAAFVFSRASYAPAWIDPGRTAIIPPTIDPFSAKNQPLDEAAVRGILVQVGLVEGPPDGRAPSFTREDGTPGRVDRAADVLRLGRPPTWETPLVVQVSRWDPLKDPLGVMLGFASLVDGRAPGGAELVLAGPNVRAVTDDPEGAAVFAQVEAAWRALPDGPRQRIHLASLPMADIEENAAIVNALQRHAAVIVQKSLHEGFGLTVTEAMWKGRAIVASAVGGIQDQLRDGMDGLLIRDPRDGEAFAAALGRLLRDPALARRLGESAQVRARQHYLGLRSLIRYAALLLELTGARPPGPQPMVEMANLT